MTSRESVTNFLSSKNLAVVGVSRKSSKFGNIIYKELKKKGINVFGVDPNMGSIEGDQCYKDLQELKGKIDGVINVVTIVAQNYSNISNNEQTQIVLNCFSNKLPLI